MRDFLQITNVDYIALFDSYNIATPAPKSLGHYRLPRDKNIPSIGSFLRDHAYAQFCCALIMGNAFHSVNRHFEVALPYYHFHRWSDKYFDADIAAFYNIFDSIFCTETNDIYTAYQMCSPCNLDAVQDFLINGRFDTSIKSFFSFSGDKMNPEHNSIYLYRADDDPPQEDLGDVTQILIRLCKLQGNKLMIPYIGYAAEELLGSAYMKGLSRYFQKILVMADPKPWRSQSLLLFGLTKIAEEQLAHKAL